MSRAVKTIDVEINVLLEAIFQRYGYDFRGYTAASMRRRLSKVLEEEALPTFSLLQNQILHDERAFMRLLRKLTVTTTSMFRDPESFSFIVKEIFPFLSTFPALKIWIAGCSTGEEVASLAILLSEAGLLQRSTIYATDINPTALESARRGEYHLFEEFSATEDNYRKAGGTRSLSNYGTRRGNILHLEKALLKNAVFSEHNLAADEVFSEVQLILCRNVLIYFDIPFQDRILDLFARSLCYKGFLCLGPSESTEFRESGRYFEICQNGTQTVRRI